MISRRSSGLGPSGSRSGGRPSGRQHAPESSRRLPPGSPGVLYLVPTPIGNLEDITLRALRVLREVDWVAAEDTRKARVLFQAHDIKKPLLSHHAHNEHRETPRLLERLVAGQSGALITDAGTPGIADPGYLLARGARAQSVPVIVLPGASAVLTGLLASGFPPEPFLFAGFLPSPAGQRRRVLGELAGEVRTIVLFETPHRLGKALGDIHDLMPERTLAVARELTKIHEQVLKGTAAEVLAALPDPLRGEIVLVLGPLPRPKGKETSAGVAVAEVPESAYRRRKSRREIPNTEGEGEVEAEG